MFCTFFPLFFSYEIGFRWEKRRQEIIAEREQNLLLVMQSYNRVPYSQQVDKKHF